VPCHTKPHQTTPRLPNQTTPSQVSPRHDWPRLPYQTTPSQAPPHLDCQVRPCQAKHYQDLRRLPCQATPHLALTALPCHTGPRVAPPSPDCRSMPHLASPCLIAPRRTQPRLPRHNISSRTTSNRTLTAMPCLCLTASFVALSHLAVTAIPYRAASCLAESRRTSP